jgi:hypothetical protein
MASQYSKYATMEPLLSGSTATYSSGSVVLYASASSPGADATLYFFNGIGEPTNIAGGSTLTADGDSGGTVSVDLSTDTFDIAGGTGCDTVIAKAGTTATLTINLDMGEVDAAAIDVATDFGIFLDGGATGNTRKDSWADIATAQAGTVTTTGLAASSGVFNWDLQNWTASTSIVDADLIGVDDGANGTLRKMTRANFLGSAAAAFSNGLTTTTLGATGDVDLGNATTDTITATGRFDSDVIPSTDSARDLGTSALQWAEAHIDAGYIDDITATGTSTLTTVDINGGAIDGTIIGAASAAAGTFAALVGTSLSVSDGNITNVGVLECDTVQSDGDAVGLNINFDGNTGTNLISMANSLASALDITQGGNSFLKFNTSDDYTTAGKEFFMSAGTSVGASGWLRFGNDSSGGGDAQLFVNGNALILSGASDIDDQGFGVTYVSGNLSASGDVMLGTSNSNVIDVNGVFKGSVMPQADDTYDLGHASYQWQDLYLDGKAYIDQLGEALDCDSQAMTNVNVDSGAIDGTVIGANSAAAGTFAAVVATSLNCSDGNITNVGSIALDSISADDGSSFSMGSNWTNASRTVADLGTVTTVDINGGTADAVVLGGASAAAATVTTLQCNSTVTCGSDGSGVNLTLYGQTANEKVVYNAGNHNLVWTDSSNATHITIGGDGTAEYAIDVATGTNNKNKMRAAAFVTYSDERLKHDVKPLRNALKTVNSLKAVNFTWKSDGGKDFGFLAQDLKKIIPQAVHGTDEGLFGVDYGRLTAVLVSAIQEQSLEIEALKAEIKNK